MSFMKYPMLFLFTSVHPCMDCDFLATGIRALQNHRYIVIIFFVPPQLFNFKLYIIMDLIRTEKKIKVKTSIKNIVTFILFLFKIPICENPQNF